MNSVEIQILKFVQETFSCDFLDAIFKFVSYIGNKGAIWIVCALILCIFKKTRKAGIISAISLIFCLTIGNMTLKPLIGRMRPYEFDTSLKVIIPLLKDASFPSGHTMAAFAFCHSTAKIYKKYRIPLYALAVFMGLSRIYLCMHFPTDVIFGAFFGILFAIASQKIYELIAKGGKRNE